MVEKAYYGTGTDSGSLGLHPISDEDTGTRCLLPSVLSGLFWSPLPLRCPTKSAPIYMLSMRGARVRFTRMLSHYLSDFKVLARGVVGEEGHT